MGKCIERLPHSCGAAQGIQVFQDEDGSYNGMCFPCGTYINDPYQDKPAGYKPPQPIRKTPEQIEEELREINECGSAIIHSRKLNQSTLDYFQVKVGVSEVDGETPAVLHRPYTKDGELVAYKNKLLGEKGAWSVGDQRDVDPFGWEQAIHTGAKALYITEGEEDAMALWQVLTKANKGTDYEDFIPAVVSIPHGVTSAVKDLLKVKAKINKHFQDVVLVFDMDKPGKDGAESVTAKVFPKAKTANLPDKDANACLLEGKTKALVKAVKWNAKETKNTKIIWGESLHEAARIPAEMGISWPWKEVTRLTRGIRKGETIYIGAGPKMGKSEVVDTLGAHLIKAHGWKVLMAKPEQANNKTYKMMAGKMVGRVFHDPNVPFDDKAYDEAGKLMHGKLAMLNLYQHMGWESLKDDIGAAVADGVDAVFIDPITNLTNGMSASDANTKLQEISQELAAMALDLDIVIFIFCHLRNPDGGPEHNRGGKILSSQFAGSRAMVRSCNYMLGLEGDKDPDLTDEERNMRRLVLIEDREFGEVGVQHLYWDRHTTLFNEA